jgi:transposase-like protein
VEVSRAKALRIAWKSKGEPPCPHNRLDAESTESGYFTGQYVCKTCGDYVQVHNYVSRRDPQDMKRPHWGRYVLYTSLGLMAAAVPVFTVWYKRSRQGDESQ